MAFVALLASVLGAVASFQSSDRLVRLTIMAGTSTWVIHNSFAGSPVGALMECAFLSSNLLGYWRYYHRSSPDLALPDEDGGRRPAGLM